MPGPHPGVGSRVAGQASEGRDEVNEDEQATLKCGCQVRRKTHGISVDRVCETHAPMFEIPGMSYSISREVEKTYYPGEDHPKTFVGPVEVSTPVEEPGDNCRCAEPVPVPGLGYPVCVRCMKRVPDRPVDNPVDE